MKKFVLMFLLSVFMLGLASLEVFTTRAQDSHQVYLPMVTNPPKGTLQDPNQGPCQEYQPQLQGDWWLDGSLLQFVPSTPGGVKLHITLPDGINFYYVDALEVDLDTLDPGSCVYAEFMPVELLSEPYWVPDATDPGLPCRSSIHTGFFAGHWELVGNQLTFVPVNVPTTVSLGLELHNLATGDQWWYSGISLDVSAESSGTCVYAVYTSTVLPQIDAASIPYRITR